ncbi:MAG: DUF5698 domain-containing protein [Treponema sp.]|jgi:uncharacterized protein YebE (UPF0316 family)|nr:DUF5698 domain-containing protein [Treponema sp.]
MNEFLINFLTAAPPLELFLIFISKIVEVAIATLRSILINRGYRKQGTILSFAEILIWVLVASRVITGLAEAPMKGVVYSIGFSLGIYIGSLLESKIAMGRVLIQTIIAKENEILVSRLREKGYAVTTMQAQGMNSEKIVLMIFANRKGKEGIIGEIQQLDETAMIITNDVSTLSGGTITNVRKLLK